MPFFPWRPKTPDAPVTPPAPDDANPANAAWLRAWLLLRGIDKKKLGAAVFTVPVIVFLAVSGLLLWVWLILRGAWAFLRSVFK
jgi:hypothetical protein